jgi:glycosyltransferase involved in cell wall biosynthesis
VSDRRAALLYVGRVSREKGLDMLPAIAERLYALGVAHRFIIVGEGPLLPTLRSRMPDAIFTGPLGREAVADAYAASDLFVFPSPTDTAGNVVLEAQASGVPVIVSGSGGPRENLRAGRTGRVCHTLDPDEWARTMAAQLSDPAFDATRAAAREYALTRTWERALEPLFRAYREVIEGASPATVLPAVQGA